MLSINQSAISKNTTAYRVIFCGMILLAVIRIGWLSDDAFISLRVVDNFINGYGLRYNIIERIQVFTHPLWVMLISLLGLTGAWLPIVTLSLCFALTAWTLWIISKMFLGALDAIAIGVILLASDAFMDFSTSGLETPLTIFLTILFCITITKSSKPSIEDREKNRYLLTQALLISLLAVTRLDNILIVVPFILFYLVKLKFKYFFIAINLPTAWAIFSLIYYGFPLPNTYYAKSLHGIELTERFERGLSYILHTIKHDQVTAAIILSGLLIPLFVRQYWLLFVGIIIHLIYIASIGGDFMAGRFLIPAFAASIYLVAILITSRDSKIIHYTIISALVLFLLFTPYHSVFASKNQPFGATSGPGFNLVDERIFYQFTFGTFNLFKGPSTFNDFQSNTITGRHSKRFRITYNAGIVAFLLGRRFHIVDKYGLADLLIARLPFRKKNWRVGHLERRIPNKYHLMAQNKFINRSSAISAQVKLFHILSRSPIFSIKRFKAIWWANFGAK